MAKLSFLLESKEKYVARYEQWVKEAEGGAELLVKAIADVNTTATKLRNDMNSTQLGHYGEEGQEAEEEEGEHG